MNTPALAVHSKLGTSRLLTLAAMLTLVVVYFNTASARAGDPPPVTANAGRDASLPREVLDAHNAARTEAKKEPLVLDPELVAVAKAHALDMARNQTMSHEGSDGSTPSQRLKKAGYVSMSSGENVARGQDSAEAVMKAWMESPHHRENVLGTFTRVGIGVARDDDGEPFWCVNFASPWPTIDHDRATSDFVRALNREREAASLPTLKAVPALGRVADGEAAVQARGESLGDGKERSDDLVAAMRKQGYQFRKLAEVASFGQPGPTEVVRSLMDSPGQRENLLGNFTDLGVGVAASKEGMPYWCLILARPADE